MLLADESLTIPLSLQPTEPWQRHVSQYNSMAEEELDKGAGRDEDLVAQLQTERKLLQKINRQISGEIQRHGSVLWYEASIASGCNSTSRCTLIWLSPGLHGGLR